MPEKSNYTEDADGYHKKDTSVQKGNANYFTRPIPPVRDTSGRPLIPGSGGQIDTARWVKEVNEREQ